MAERKANDAVTLASHEYLTISRKYTATITSSV
jgi:hypothetical protein